MGKLVKAKGNMYDWVTHLWNPIMGCPNQCTYCYVKKFRVQPKEVTLDKIFPKLGTGNTIFVGHLTDIFSHSVPYHWVTGILEWCDVFYNDYIFQTKCPDNAIQFSDKFPLQTTIGTTIETDNEILLKEISPIAPIPEVRANYLCRIKANKGIKTFLTIEPIMDFDVTNMLGLIQTANPNFINIGADSKGHNLLEPPAWKIKMLIAGIENLKIEIREKSNLQRLLKEGEK